ncbi:A disintegrin and metalloproteinase with thrombospondin motifs like [Artemia franciscana]|uniref:Peptidase M12B domain-containing protein n=1 Tax=Artemia franciscana TaxID=6661 RepID=A0AA88IP72_ARTSF|nr:hypothetical protein QYM36_001583 [Artemia franciscana]
MAHLFNLVILLQCSFGCLTLKIHEEMSSDEIRSLFHVESHTEVPEYEVAHIRSIARRSALEEHTEDEVHRQINLEAFGKKYQLKLRRNGNLLKRRNQVRLWVADSGGIGNISLQEVPQSDDIGDIYQDIENEAAIILNHDPEDDELQLHGTLGNDFVIKPVPSKLKKKILPKLAKYQRPNKELFMSEEEFFGSELLGSGMQNISRTRRSSMPVVHSAGTHVIFRRKNKESTTDYMFMEPDHLPSKRKRSVKRKREAPGIIFPEILVIVDYDGYRLHGGDNAEIKKYFVSFWNGVDLRYKLLKSPRVRISIAGIIISRGRDATPYFEQNRVGRNAIDSTAALTDMGKYLFQERRLPVYDIAVAVTKLDMCRREFPTDDCNRGTAGFAYVGGACVVNKRLEKVNSVAIVEDTGGFSGIIVAAHEVGHLLGSVHDGSPPPSYLGGPGATRCRWEDGYIMSDLRHTDRGFRWSPCSVSQFHHFLNGDTASCMYNSPHEDAVLPRVLPGKLLSLDAQCRMDRGTSACFKDDRVCAQLFCFDASSGYCVSYRPAAEGSLCGDNHICVAGKCVIDNDNAIPDYSEDVHSFLRKSEPAQAATQAVYHYTKAPVKTTTTTKKPTTTSWKKYNYRSSTPSSGLATTTQYNWWNYWLKRTPSENKYTYSSKLATTSTTAKSTTTTTTRAPTSKVTKRQISEEEAGEKSRVTVYTTPKKAYKWGYWLPSSTEKTVSSFSNVNKKSVGSTSADQKCEDKITNIAGSMSCEEFLSRYGFQYCKHSYITRNCCAAQRKLCRNS